jgi:hypothetical protein
MEDSICAASYCMSRVIMWKNIGEMVETGYFPIIGSKHRSSRALIMVVAQGVPESSSLPGVNFTHHEPS